MITDDPMLMAELAAAKREEQDLAWRCQQVGPCIFAGCVSRDRHWHGGFPGGYDNPADPTGPPILFTTEPAPGVRDYNGALLAPNRSWHAEYHGGRFEDCPAPTCSGEVPA